jgi:uncharacterized protein (TIGR00297 family)
MLLDILIGLLISLVIAYLAYLKKSLTLDGLLTATILGSIIYAFGTIVVWASLILFFISSSLITKIHEKKDKQKSNGRNYIQVFANSFIATLFSILFYTTKNQVFLIAAVISIASSNSDTWASEIGILSKGKTYSIVTFKVVEKGLSGAISSLGTFASFFGSLFIGLVFLIAYGLYYEFSTMLLWYTIVVSLGGFVGCLVDSYLGALVQAKYKGVKSGRITEKPFLEGEKVVLASGFAFITNDLVNFLSGLASTAVSMLILVI